MDFNHNKEGQNTTGFNLIYICRVLAKDSVSYTDKDMLTKFDHCDNQLIILYTPTYQCNQHINDIYQGNILLIFYLIDK